jgi:hypothetical protein
MGLLMLGRLSLAIATALLLGVAPSAWALPDYDGDGSVDGDCAPLDAAVFPGAADKPDLTFEDTNCDGIDGDAARAVFVAPTGRDGAAGTREDPERTIAAALGAGRDVYVAGGTYGAVQAVANVGIYGGYVAGSWSRSDAAVTTIEGSPQAVLADGDRGVVLQLLTLRGGSGGSAYGLRAINGSQIAASRVTADGGTAGGGAAGGAGETGANGAPGNPGACEGGVGGPGGGTGDSAGGAGGDGGSGPMQTGEPGSPGSSPSPTIAPGASGPAGETGGDGSPGSSGGDGTPAPLALGADAPEWTGAQGTAGQAGGPGSGGGGGGGGAGGGTEMAPIFGAGGSGGGSGAAGGGGGQPGASGGGSFGVYLNRSSLVASDSRLAGGIGGNGGDGGSGGPRGQGGPGAPSTTCPGAGAGGAGGAGGPGGPGGTGGAGAGGPSVGVFRSGAGSAYVDRNASEQAGSGGSGGNDGQELPVMTAPDTPQNAPHDFDGDQVVDGDDACPEIAGPGTANGCPARPDKLPDADGDHIPDSADACPSTPRGNDPNEDGCPDGSEPPPPPPPAENPPSAAPPSAPPPAPRAQPARVGATVRFRSSNRGRNTVFSSLLVRNIPGGATVVVRCRGKGCPVRRFVKRRAVGTLSLRQFVGKRLRPGIVLDIQVTKAGFVGLVKDITIRAGRSPRVKTLCLPPGSSRASRC